jgi:hypothetical protein
MTTHALALPSNSGLIDRLNIQWHERALQIFMLIVLAHWSEHLSQAVQVYLLGWARPDSRGALGQFFPWLVKSEVLHYGYAIIMLIGIWTLRKGFEGRAYTFWMIAFWIQFWHHIEHGLLQAQAILGANLFGSPTPVSIAQLWIPRVELHLFYNTIVFIPMVIGMYYHIFPPAGEVVGARCTCGVREHVAKAA